MEDAKMNIGDRFNPWNEFVGAYVPNWLMLRLEISAGAKLTYARLCQFSGKQGKCFPKQETLRESLGVSERSIRNYVAELEKHRLIEVEQCGLQQPNRYHFLRHPWMLMDADEQPGAANFAGQDRKESATQERQTLPVPNISEENQKKREAQSALPLDVETKKKRFTPPSKQEVSEHFKSLGMNGSAEKEAETFVNYYEARGWMMGKVKMQKWKAAATNWKNRQDDRNAPPVAGKDESAYWQDYPAWIASKPPKYAEFKDHRYAPDFIKTEYHKERKAQRARNVRISDGL